MSYDLMVFDPKAAPRDRDEFKKWFRQQTTWSEDHDYNDPDVCLTPLAAWFHDMIKTFPAMNGPYRAGDPLTMDNPDNPYLTDYSIGYDIIYAGFRWSVAKEAYAAVVEKAAVHRIGFFDVSGSEGNIVFPGETPTQIDSPASAQAAAAEAIAGFFKDESGGENPFGGKGQRMTMEEFLERFFRKS